MTWENEKVAEARYIPSPRHRTASYSAFPALSMATVQHRLVTCELDQQLGIADRLSNIV